MSKSEFAGLFRVNRVRNHPSVSVIILNYNGRDLLKECLPTILDQDYVNYEVIVFDNGSQDGSVKYVQDEFRNVRLCTANKNLGFAAGNNRVVDSLRSEYVILLNNDTRVARSFISRLVDNAEREQRIASVAPRIVRPTGPNLDGPQFTNRGFLVPLLYSVFSRRYEHLLRYSHVCLANAATAAIYKRLAFLDVGGFDEDFFATFEDFDLGWRLALRGYISVYIPETLVWHRGGATTQTKPVFNCLWTRNMLSAYFKNLEAWNVVTHLLPLGISMPLLLVFKYLASRIGWILSATVTAWHRQSIEPPRVFPTKNLVESFRGLLLFFRQLERIGEKRKSVQELRRVPDRKLFRMTEHRCLL
jgi:hypothetical protein